MLARIMRPWGKLDNTFAFQNHRHSDQVGDERIGLRVSNRRGARAKQHSLTSREIEVLTWVARGKSAWEIGEILNITKRTVDEHAQTAVRKIGAVNRAHAVALAVRDRIISI